MKREVIFMNTSGVSPEKQPTTGQDVLPKINLAYLENHPDPWVRYRTRLDLVGLPPDDPLVRQSRAEMLGHPLIKGLLAELADWPGKVLNSHKSASQPFHKLAFLAEIGLTAEDNGVSSPLAKIATHVDPHGIPRLPVGSSEGGWALCDAPLLLWIMRKMDPAGDVTGQTAAAVGYLAELARANGWPCTVSEELGSFRGPGRKADPCPYATLLMLKLLLDGRDSLPVAVTSPAVATGIQVLLDLWQESLVQHPYQFYMGTDFRKLKAPLVWYDLLHVLDVLSRSPMACRDSRYAEMLRLLNSQSDANGLFTPGSEYQAWRDWEFGQKKQPSAWLTFLAHRINLRTKRGRQE